MTQAEVYKFLNKHRGKKFKPEYFNEKFNFKAAGPNLYKMWLRGEVQRVRKDVYNSYEYWIP